MANDKKYPVLKCIYFEMDKDENLLEKDLFINNPYLIIGLIFPEIPQSVEVALNRLNLTPYEHTVSKYGVQDAHYDVLMMGESGKRTIKGLDYLYASTTNENGKCPVIVSYLEFTND